MLLTVRPFETADSERWDAFCAISEQATLLHTRKFLSYHGDRFTDRSLLVEADGKLLGVFPAAEHPTQRDHIVSHPGATYGGMVHNGALRAARMLAAVQAVGSHYRSHGYQRLIYKAVPGFYQRRPSQDDLYALFRLGAVRTRCDISSTIDLQARGAVSERRRRSLKKAMKSGIVMVSGSQWLPALWEVLVDNLERKHGCIPVHTLDEISLLASRFPDAIRCVCAILDQQVVAGILLFETATAAHAQYIASSETGYLVSALDAVVDHCIEAAVQGGKRWFDFGISTEAGGMHLNEGLFGFKTEFGSGGFIHEFYELALKDM